MKEKKVKTPNKTADNSKVESVLENFSKPIAEPPKKKYGWISMVLLIVIIGVGIFFMVKLATTVTDSEIRSLGEILANLDVKYALIAVAALVGVMLLESAKFFTITHATTGLLKPLNSVKVAFLGKYYDGITPFSAGGQPMQIYYLHKKGHSAGVSTAIVMIKYFINMLCWVTLCFLLMTINRGALTKYVDDVGQQHFFMGAGWIGWSINAISPFAIVIFAIFPKMTNKILLFFINIITKCSFGLASKKESRTGKSQFTRKKKIIKRKQKWINSAYSAVKDFRASFAIMSHKPIHFIILVLVCISESFITYAIPYFIAVAFGNDLVPIGAETMFAIMTLNIYASMSVAVVPTPGNSGVLENVMVLVFKVLTTSVVFWVVFTWRFFTYYVYILIGIGITIFEVIRKAVRSRKSSRNE